MVISQLSKNKIDGLLMSLQNLWNSDAVIQHRMLKNVFDFSIADWKL